LNPLILVVDDEPDVEMLFRQQFRHDLRFDRFKMEFAQSGDMALQRIADAADVSLILRRDAIYKSLERGDHTFEAVRRAVGNPG
jgi:CheY-like chemotaxis protein